jgi:hypothetical protein
MEVITHAFTTRELPQKLSFFILVLIPKTSGGVCGIGLLETVWKVISLIFNRQITQNINLHDALHGFRAKRGTGTAILEARLHLDVSIQCGLLFHQVFLDVSNAYDTLDRTRTLEILKQYGMGPNILQILKNFWEKLHVVPHQSGFYG